MAGLVKWEPDNVLRADVLRNAIVPRTTDFVDPPEDGPSWGDTLRASFAYDNNVAYFAERRTRTADLTDSHFSRTLAEAHGGGERAPALSDVNDPTWNVYSHIQNDWDDERRKRLEPFVRKGEFADVWNPRELEEKARVLEYDLSLKEQLANGPTSAAVVGSLAGAISDPLSYMAPLAVLNRIKTIRNLSRPIKGALLGTAAVAPQELALQSQQQLRETWEAYMNIGFGAALGGAGGTLAAAYSRLRHPANPLNTVDVAAPHFWDQQTIRIEDADGNVDEIFPASVGAMSSADAGPRKASGLFTKVPYLGKATDWLATRTLAGRALSYSDGDTRGILSGLMDLGGIFTSAARSGIKMAESAEDIQNALMRHYGFALQFSEFKLNELNRELGQSGLSQRVGLQGSIKVEDFQEAVRRQLLNDFDDEFRQTLAAKYGDEITQKIEDVALLPAERYKALNQDVAKELKFLGRLQDEALVGKLEGDIRALDRRIAGTEAQKTPETRTAAEDDIKKLKELRKEKMDALREERSKPADLGDAYGHAQMWNRHGILANIPEMRAFLLRVLSKEPNQEWLDEAYGLTLGDFKSLGKADVELPDGRTLTPDDGAKLRDTIIADWVGDEKAFRIKQAELQLESAQVAEKEALQEFNDVARTYGLLKRDEKRLSYREAKAKTKEAREALVRARAERDAAKAEAKAFTEAATAARQTGLDRASQLDTRPTKAVRPTLESARQGERARNAAETLAKADRRLKQAEEVHSNARMAFEELQRRRELTRTAREAVGDAQKDLGQAAAKAGKATRKAERTLKRVMKAPSLDDEVEDLLGALTNSGRVPNGILDGVAVDTGRVKERRIHLTPEERRYAESQRFLRKDLGGILPAQYNQLGGWIGLHKALDVRKGGRFESWQAVQDKIVENYRAAQARNPAQRVALEKEMQSALADLNSVKDRLLGTANTGTDPDGWVHWLAAKARQLNLVRFMGGFLISSLTDPASVALRTGSIGKLVFSYGPQTVRILKDMYRKNPTMFEAMLHAQEMGSQGIRMAKLYGADDLGDATGIGVEGTLTHSVTSKVDRFGRWATETGNVASGMRLWNRFWKITHGIYRANYLKDVAGRYASLSAREVQELASLGLGKTEMDRLNRYFQKYGKTDESGAWDPHLDDWVGTQDGREAMRDFTMAVDRDMRRGVFTPGIGDTPRLMDRDAAKVMLQFQSYSFTFVNRFLIPASQRLRQGDLQPLISMAHLAWLGTMVVAMKKIQRGEDVDTMFDEENIAQTAYDIVDRSGMLAYASPYLDSGIKLAQGAGWIEGAPNSMRYARNSWGATALGPSVGLFNDIQRLFSETAAGNTDKALTAAAGLAPFGVQLRAAVRMADVLGDL